METLPVEFVAALQDRYRLSAELGRGGMATVYSARDLRHDREVAIKVLHPEVATAIGTDRFQREIAITAALEHPRLLALLDSGVAAGRPYYVMPLVRGETLRALLDREGQLPLDLTLRIAGQVAEGLSYAHGRGVVHRDIKPENILLDGDEARLADFGIARELDAATQERLTSTGVSIGTPLYMSPEQGLGDRRLDARSDQYSLACVVYEMLAGSPPFTGPTARAVVARHGIDPVPPIRTVRPNVPVAVTEALERALAKVPADRFGAIGDFIAALNAPAAGAPAPRRVWVRPVGAALLVATGAALVWWLAVPPRSRPLDAHQLTILPFITHCTPSQEAICEGVAGLLSATLSGAGEYRAVDVRTTYRAAELATAGEVTLPRGRAIARSLGAGIFVFGRVAEAGGQLRITAALYRTDGEDAPIGEGQVQGPPDDLFRLIDQLAGRVFASLGQGESGKLVRLATAMTDSLDALKLFMTAEFLIRGGRYDSAQVILRQAVAVDTGFTLGWARLLEVLTYSDGEVGDIPQRIAHGIARLPWRDSVLASTFLVGDSDEKLRMIRQLIDRDPRDPAGWGALGDELLHSAMSQGRSLEEAQGAFERALQLGDTSVRNVNHLNWIAAMRRDRVSYVTYLELALRQAPAGFMAPVHRLELATIRGDGIGVESALRAIDGPDPIGPWGAANRLAIAGRLHEAEAPARLLTAGRYPRELQALGHAILASLAAGQGRYRMAWTSLRAASAIDLLYGTEVAAALTLVARSPMESQRESLLVALRALRGRPRTLPAEVDQFFYPDRDAHAAIQAYLIGRLAASLGRPEEVAPEIQRLLSTRSFVHSIPSLNGDLALSLGALRDLEQGRQEEALAQLVEAAAGGHGLWAFNSLFLSAGAERDARARALVGLGRDEEALVWYRNLGLTTHFDVVYLPEGLIRSGEILERLGRPAEARAKYQELLQLWCAADPELQEIVQDVGQRLIRLGGRPSSCPGEAQRT